jgi:hypothetical protein
VSPPTCTDLFSMHALELSILSSRQLAAKVSKLGQEQKRPFGYGPTEPTLDIRLLGFRLNEQCRKVSHDLPFYFL